MNDRNEQRIFGTFEWRWFVVAYCSLILFHLIPSYLLFGLRRMLFFQDPASFLLWICLGIVIVSVFVAYRSNGWTLFEPSLASLLYITTVYFMFPVSSSRSALVSLTRTRLSFMALAFALGFAAAIVGELLQARKLRKWERAVGDSRNPTTANS